MRSESEDIKDAFIKYAMKAIKNRKKDYLRKREYLNQHEETVDSLFPPYFEAESLDIFEQSKYFQSQIENEELDAALSRLNPRERSILFLRIVDGWSYHELAPQMHLGYKGAAALYYRAYDKVKSAMQKGKGKQWNRKA